MPRAQSSIAVFLVMLPLAFPAAARPAAVDSNAEMDLIFELSGLDAQLGSMSATVSQSLEAQLSALPTQQLEVVKRTALREFGHEALRRSTTTRLRRLHHAQHAQATLHWLRSPLGRRIAQAETAAASADGAQGMLAYAEHLKQSPPTTARMDLVRRLDTTAGATDFSTEATLAAAISVALAANAALDPARRQSEEDLRGAAGAQRDALRAQLEQVTLVSMLYSYRQLSDDELRRYIRFAGSQAGRWFHGVSKRAVLETITDASTGVGRALGAQLAPEAGPAPAQLPR